MSKWKQRQLQAAASALGLTLEEYLASTAQEKEKAPPTSEAERKRQAQDRKRHMAAISWAARERGASYGKLLPILKPGEKAEIYHAYEKYQATRNDPVHDAELRAIGEKIKRIEPRQIVINEERRRFDAALANSNEQTDITEVLGI